MPGDHKICPGQSTMFWRPEDIFEIPCPTCGRQVEFFKTDIKRACRGCGTNVLNPRADLACAEWCAAARECLGPVIYDQVKEKQELDRRREADLKALTDAVDPSDQDVRALFETLCRENRNADRLIDTDRLFLLKDENEALFTRAIGYYSRFVARLKQSEASRPT